MIEFELKPAFKGDRNYIHGTTILDETTKALAQIGHVELSKFDFSIHRMTSSNLKLILGSLRTKPPAGDDVAIMKFSVDGEQMQACIKSTNETPEGRHPYNESLITNRCNIDAERRSIQLLDTEFNFSNIEVLVSMNKALHLAVLRKPDNTSWVFCRWESAIWPLPTDLKGVMITLGKLVGTRLTAADVELAGRRLGKIYFSAKEIS